MISISEFFVVILYILGAILLVTLIAFVFRMMKTLDKIDVVIDDVSNKSSKLDGVFSLVDKAADAVNVVSDGVTQLVVNGITSIVNRKKTKGREGIEDE